MNNQPITLKSGKHGFHLNFPNGLTLSIQYGTGHYCNNRSHSYSSFNIKHDELPIAQNAEIAILKGGELQYLLNDTILGWVSFKNIIELCNILNCNLDPDKALELCVEYLRSDYGE